MPKDGVFGYFEYILYYNTEQQAVHIAFKPTIYIYLGWIYACTGSALEGYVMIWCKSKQRPAMRAYNTLKLFLRHLITRHCIQYSHTNNITTHTYIQIRTQPSTFTLCLSPSLIHAIALHIYLPLSRKYAQCLIV